VHDDVALGQPADREQLLVDRDRADAAVLHHAELCALLRLRRWLRDLDGLIALHERALDLEVAALQLVVDEELDLGRTDEAPAPFARVVEDDRLELGDDGGLDLLELGPSSLDRRSEVTGAQISLTATCLLSSIAARHGLAILTGRTPDRASSKEAFDQAPIDIVPQVRHRAGW
jgi:hypothetical protein